MRLSFLSLALVAALSTGCVASNDDGLVDCGNANDSDCNAKVIAELRAAGSDMDATHQIEFYVYYPTRAEADAAAKQLAGRNFKTSVDGPDEDQEYALLAMRESKLDLAAIDAMEREVQQVVAGGKGYYDGWEAAVVE